jgi:alpha-1,6-mannosyltransferase
MVRAVPRRVALFLSSDRAVSHSLPRLGACLPRTAFLLRRVAAAQPLLAPCAAGWLIYVALAALLQSPALRIYDAGWLSQSQTLQNATHALMPDVLMSAAGRQSVPGTIVVLLYVTLAGGALAAWCWAVRLGKTIEPRSIALILALTTWLAAPLLVAPGLFSDDVYLYGAYGRTIAEYGANPILHAPSAFPSDPLYPWVHWKELAASYGPLWLMLSAPLSALAGDSVSAAVVIYRSAALVLHLFVAASVWYVLSRRRRRDAVAGTLFYAWNPLVLIEVVGNAHNDILVGLFAVLLVAAAAQRAWSSAAFFAACAIMVKPFAGLLLPPLALRLLEQPGPGRLRRVTRATLVGAATMVAISLPLWAGLKLLENITTNPASYGYTNTLWELLAVTGASWFGVAAESIQRPYLDALRMAAFFLGVLWVLTRPWGRRHVAKSAFALWLVFSLTAAWVWPWYFVPAIALSVFAGRGAVALATALTVGGLLFWAAWTPPPFTTVHTWRAVLLFGPVLVTLAWAPLRALVLDVLGSTRPLETGDDDGLRIRLQTAPG